MTFDLQVILNGKKEVRILLKINYYLKLVDPIYISL